MSHQHSISKNKKQSGLKDTCYQCVMKGKCDLSTCYKMHCKGPFKDRMDFIFTAQMLINSNVYEKCY